MKAIVLGSVPSSGNIGDAIANLLRTHGWETREDDCQFTEDVYLTPDYSLEEYDACVITLGTSCMTPMSQIAIEDIGRVIHGSLTLPLLCIRQYVQERKTNGKIVVMGSYAHDHWLTNSASYCAAKAGLTAAVKALGWELTPDFLTYIVHPYHVDGTPLGKKVVQGMIEQRGMTPEEVRAYQRKDLRMPEMLTVNEVAEVVVQILKPTLANAWLSGQGFSLYGGVR